MKSTATQKPVQQTSQPLITKSGGFEKVNKPMPEGYTSIVEGTATILHTKGNQVFYNNVQVFNRDLSVLVIKMFDKLRREEHQAHEGFFDWWFWIYKNLEKKKQKHKENYKPFPLEDLTILEALSASGLRSIRYWKEIPGVKRIIANDLSESAVQEIKRNINFNDIPETCIVPNMADAIEYMILNRSFEKQFNVVDIDPFGSAAPFLDGAVQSVRDGGLLCITCTDMAVLAGSQPSTCYAKYGAVPVKTKAYNEMALRIVLAAVQQQASKYGRYIVPLISCSIDFYVRLFIRVFSKQGEAKKAWSRVANVYQCSGCSNFHLQPLARTKPGKSEFYVNTVNYDKKCEQCGWNFHLGGPIWSAPIHDIQFVKMCIDHVKQNRKLFSTEKRLTGMLTVISKELTDVPLYYVTPALTIDMKSEGIPINTLRSAILNANHRVSQSHCDPNAIKTDIPIDKLYDIFRAWRTLKKQTNKPKSNTPSAALLAKEQKFQPNFTEREDAKGIDIPVFLPNPEKNWGPKSRPKQSKRKPEDTKENPQKKQKKE